MKRVLNAFALSLERMQANRKLTRFSVNRVKYRRNFSTFSNKIFKFIASRNFIVFARLMLEVATWEMENEQSAFSLFQA